MRVRRAVPDDAAGLAEVHVRSWQVGYRGQLPDDLLDALEPAQRIPRWQAALNNTSWPGRGCLLAEDDDAAGTPLGFSNLCATQNHDQDPESVGEITSFYVAPHAWNRGVGRQLMDVSLATLAEAGYGTGTLWVLATNIRAIRFYEASGWRADGADKQDTIDGVEMTDLRYLHDLGDR